MDSLELLEALHRPNTRQGPGSDTHTRAAMQLAGLDSASKLRIADLGCGTGAAALCLAANTASDITAVDFLPGFVDELNSRSAQAGLERQIHGVVGDIATPPFEPGELDLIWSEGAIYNLGFIEGLELWRPFLRPGGVLTVSELTWLSSQRPPEISKHWDSEYTQVATAGAKIAQLEDAGYDLLGYFTLPPECWLDHYYLPLQAGLPAFLESFAHSPEARAIADAEEQEFHLYQRFGDHYSYGFFVARRRS